MPNDDDIAAFGDDIANSQDWNDIDRDMWSFFTPTPFQDAPETAFNGPRPDVSTSRPTPPGVDPFYGLLVQRDCPPWQCPSIWGFPFDFSNEICVPWQCTDEVVISQTVGVDQLFFLSAVSYEFDQDCVNNGDSFTVRVLRDGQPLAEWTDMVVDNAQPDPANRYLLAGHLEPMQCFLRFDFDQTISITVRYNGQIGSDCDAGAPLNCNGKILVQGYATSLRDRRQGAPKFITSGAQDRLDPDLERLQQFAARHYEEMGKREL